jgi:ABC-type polysaccharide/polyol phosphate export permease
MFSTSVVYPIHVSDSRLRFLLALNPMTPIIDAYRAVVLKGAWPSPEFAAAAGLSLILVVAAVAMFHRAEYEFAENI